MRRLIRNAGSRSPVPPAVLVGLVVLLLLTAFALFYLPSLAIPGPPARFDAATKDLESARSALRGTILQSAGAMLLVFGALATWHSIQMSRGQQQNDQFVRAIELLTKTRTEGEAQRPVQAAHIGAIYSLERIMRTHSSYQPAIVAVLAAYIRQNSPVSATNDGLDSRPLMARRLGNRQPAVWWALDALMRRVPRPDDPAIDLSSTDLRYSTIDLTRLAPAHLEGADLRGCELRGGLDGTADAHTRWPKDAPLGNPDEY
jgi:hypothetical protein